MNILFMIGDKLITPASSDTILDGLTRRSVIDIANDWGLNVEERKIAVEKDMSDISEADLAELVTKLQTQITSLQASQQAFVKISDLNLFQFIR